MYLYIFDDGTIRQYNESVDIDELAGQVESGDVDVVRFNKATDMFETLNPDTRWTEL